MIGVFLLIKQSVILILMVIDGTLPYPYIKIAFKLRIIQSLAQILLRQNK